MRWDSQNPHKARHYSVCNDNNPKLRWEVQIYAVETKQKLNEWVELQDLHRLRKN